MPRVRSLRTQALSPKRDASSRRSPSPTFSEATNASVLDFGPNGPQKIITRANLKASVQAYDDLLNKCATYRAALMTVSRAAAGFADSMENCSGLKGPTYESGTRMQAAAGLHHLIGNHYHVMAETLDKQFEKPLRQHLDTYRSVVTERSTTYEKMLREKSNLIRQTEMSNMKQKGRNLQTFREALAILQRQVDELDDLKAQHYQEIVEHEEEVWDFVQGKVCLVVRSTMDVFDRLTAKASDPVIEPMLQTIPDPFDSYGPPPAEDQIFSILPPLSVISHPSTAASPMTASTPLDGSDGHSSAQNSWSRNGFFPDAGAWAADVHSTSPPSGSGYTSGSTSASGSTSLATSPARSVSPPGAVRRHTHPHANTIASPSFIQHHTRKSETSLRTVLSVIDEGRAKPRANGNGHGNAPEIRQRTVSLDSTASTSTTGSRNGKAPDLGDSDSDASVWAGFKLAPPPRGASGNGAGAGAEDDTTPRNTMRFRGPSPLSSSVESLGDLETPPLERSRSPQSDDTATLTPLPS